MSGITTHVLDVAAGRPAAGIEVKVYERNRHGEWRDRGKSVTNHDGRAEGLFGSNGLEASIYRLRFEVADYFERQGTPTFFPFVDVVFQVVDPAAGYHVPLLLSPWGYSTYRGS